MMDAKAADPVGREGHPWDKAADGWNRHSHEINAWLDGVTQAMLDAAHIGAADRVLDVAAGAGGQTLDIARRVGDKGYVLATDISSRILSLAAENARLGGLIQVHTRVADAQNLGLAGWGFDAAVSRLGLMFCSVPQLAFRQIAAALKPGGRIAGIVFSQPRANPCAAILMATACRHAGLPPPPPFTPGTLFSLGEPGLLAQLLATAGFADIEVKPVAAPFRLPSSAHYLDFVRSAGSPVMEIVARLSQSVQAAAWDDMAAQLAAFAGPSGWEGPNELLLFSGRLP